MVDFDCNALSTLTNPPALPFFQPLFRKKYFFLSESTDTGDSSTPASSDGGEKPLGDTLFVVDATEVKKTIAANWGFILLGGSASLSAGAYLLSLPLFATEVALLSSIATLFGIGFFNLLSGFYAEKGYKAPGILVGLSQMALGYMYATEPEWVTAAATTLGLCFVVMTEGFYRIALALQNSESDGFWVTLLSGMTSVIGSAWIMKFLDVTSAVVPGLALGLGLVSGGISRIVVSLAGREYANDAIADATF